MDSSFFKGNRQRLVEALEPGSLVVMTAFGRMQRDVDEPFAYQQESNFWYLTGIEEPEWLLIMDVDSGDEWLVAPVQNRYQLAFEGEANHHTIAARSGVTKILPKAEGWAALKRLLAKKKQVYSFVPRSRRVYGFQPNAAPRKLLRQLKGPKLIDVVPILAKRRAIKQPAEIEAIQAAVDVTVDGLLAVLKELKTYTFEYEIDAKLYYEFRRRGAIHGFDPIVASGHKTCVMHSPAANDPLQDWLLLDVGARVHGYSADITRTIPLKEPTDRQREVYEAVQRMHDHFLDLLKPGANVKDVLMKDAYPFVGEEMVKLGLLKKPLLNEQNVFKFMPHGITHGLGVEVHDPLGRPEVFQEGMVLTDEVGVYIPDEGFGVRVENDVVITKDGARNMAARLPIALGELKMLY
jgi:Xaa-Pro aminopeptidase